MAFVACHLEPERLARRQVVLDVMEKNLCEALELG